MTRNLTTSNRGEWDADTTYQMGMVLWHAGQAWASDDNNNLGNEPGVDPGWTQVSTGGAAPGTGTFLTATDESTDLPNSRQLIAGTNVTFDDTVPNARTMNVGTGGVGGTGTDGTVPMWTGGGVDLTDTGVTWSSPCLTIGADTDNQAVVCGSSTGDPVTLSATGGDLSLEATSGSESGVVLASGALSVRLGKNDDGDRGFFFDSPSTPWVSTLNKGLNVEPGRSSGAGHPLSLSGGEPALITDADGGGVIAFGTNGLGTGTGGHVQIGAGSGDPVTGTGGSLFLSSGDGNTPGDIIITASAGGPTGNLSVGATASSFTGTVQIATRTGTPATFATFDSSGKLVDGEPVSAASGSFTTVDLKTVTVVNGIITSIV